MNKTLKALLVAIGITLAGTAGAQVGTRPDDLPDFIQAAACRSQYMAIGTMQQMRGDQVQSRDNLTRAAALDRQWDHLKGYKIARENFDVSMKSSGDQLPQMLGRLASACRPLGLPPARV
jgi:hypothetical protein